MVNSSGKIAETYKYESNNSTNIDKFHCVFEKQASWKPYGKDDQEELISCQIMGVGLCIIAMQSGDVQLYDFATGSFVYKLNTH